MKTKRPLVGLLLAVTLLVAIALPFVSWILSALGQPVGSLLSDDGLRWLFIHLPDPFFNYWVLVALCAFSSLASLQYVRWGQSESPQHSALMVSFALALFIDILLLLAAFHSRSPLISLSGRLYPSPFFHGLPFVVCFGLMLVAYVYGVLTHRITNLSSFSDFLSSGFRLYGDWMVLVMLLSFIFHCLRYIC
jgi:aminobenzoyl-glutamate transport protein